MIRASCRIDELAPSWLERQTTPEQYLPFDQNKLMKEFNV
jgi:hypothetical protein